MTEAVIVVSDTSAISNLIKIDKLFILTGLFPKIVIPPAVFSEIMQLDQFDIPLQKFLEAYSRGQMETQIATDSDEELTELRRTLDKGESEAIILAGEIDADLLLMDERLGRKIAIQRGLAVIGLLGVLRLAKQEKIIESVKPLLDDLRHKAGFWFSNDLYQEVLTSVDE